jgi:hypothetical protein
MLWFGGLPSAHRFSVLYYEVEQRFAKASRILARHVVRGVTNDNPLGSLEARLNGVKHLRV